jgi:hypothetical protein
MQSKMPQFCIIHLRINPKIKTNSNLKSNSAIRYGLKHFRTFDLPDDEEIPFLLSSTMLRIEKTDLAARGPGALATFGET